MGLFSGSKKTFVSSVVYNLAGALEDRPDFLKTSVVGSVLSGTKKGMGEVLAGNYLTGPGIKLRSFGRWARTQGYSNAIGMAPVLLNTGSNINRPNLIGQIPHGSDETVVLQSAEVGVADYTFWADEYMLQNHIDIINDNWIVDFNEPENLIEILLPNGAEETFTPQGYDKDARYLYVRYNLTTGREEGPVVTGETIILQVGEDFPDTTGWDLDISTSQAHTVPLVQTTHVVVSYSDGRPNEVTDDSTSRDETYNDTQDQYSKTTYKGETPEGGSIWSEKQIMVRDEKGVVLEDSDTTTKTETIPGGVTKTTTTTVTTQYIDYWRKYRIDTQKIIDKSWSPVKVFIYRRNSGNAVLDAMFEPNQGAGTILPFIPIRLDNRYLSETHPDLYPLAKKALKKATGGKYDKLVKNINDNPSIGDIDYAYCFFGVALNVEDDSSKRYIYEFFQEIMLGAGGTGSAYLQWRTAYLAAHQAWLDWVEWQKAQFGNGGEPPQTPEPPMLPYPEPPNYTVSVVGRSDLNLNMQMSWMGMNETVGSGVKKPGAKKGDLWWEVVGNENFVQGTYLGPQEDGSYPVYQYASVDHVRLTWQSGSNTWRSIDIWGLWHSNMIYGGKSVDISSIQALQDPDESGFLVPVHEEIFKNLSIKDSTQMATSCSFLVFNCYQVVKQKWYTSGFFKIVIVAVVIAVTIYTGGFGAESAGVLGTNASVGATLGFSGVAAVVAGAVANAIAAMIIYQIISSAATELLGDKLGVIIGVVASVITIYAIGAYTNGTNPVVSYGDMMKADNILKLTTSIGNGYAEYIKASAQDVLNQTQELNAAYESEASKIASLYKQNIGYGRASLDPMRIIESLDSFLTRTLMTGNDIVDMSLGMIGNFADVTLNTSLDS